MMDLAHNQPRPEEEIEAWKKRDPIRLFKEKLLNRGIVTDSDLEKLDREIESEIEEADRFASESPLPDIKNLHRILYAE